MKRSSPSIYSSPGHIHRQEPRRGAVPSGGVDGNAAEPVAGEDLPDRSDRPPGGVVVAAQVAQVGGDGDADLPARPPAGEKKAGGHPYGVVGDGKRADTYGPDG